MVCSLLSGILVLVVLCARSVLCELHPYSWRQLERHQVNVNKPDVSLSSISLVKRVNPITNLARRA